MAQGDIIRFVRNVQVDGQTHVNVLHFLDNVAERADQLAALLDQWDTLAETFCPENELKSIMRGYTSIVTVGISAQVIFPEKGEVMERAIEIAPSDALDSGLPTFAQVKFSISTTLNSRSGRGGFYIGAIPESQTNGNLVDSTYQTNAGYFIGSLLSNFGLGGSAYDGFALGVWSELLQDWNLVTAISMATDMGTMRSRRLGRGV